MTGVLYGSIDIYVYIRGRNSNLMAGVLYDSIEIYVYIRDSNFMHSAFAIF